MVNGPRVSTGCRGWSTTADALPNARGRLVDKPLGRVAWRHVSKSRRASALSCSARVFRNGCSTRG